MACRVPSDDGDSGADDTDAAVRLQGSRMVAGLHVLDGDGSRHFLLLLSHVQSPRTLREGWSPPYPIPRARR